MKIAAFVSGGKDSIAMALRLWKLDYKFTIVSIFTEFEFPAVKEQVYKLSKLTNLPSIILETPRGTWDKWFYGKITRGKAKGEIRGARFALTKRKPFCWYKREAKDKFFKKINKNFDLAYIGITADEKRRIRDNPKFVYPLTEWNWGESEIKDYLKEKGFWIKEYELFPHTGCFLCPYQSKKAWINLKLHYPELFKIAYKYHLDNLKLVGIPIIPKEVI